MQENGFNLWVWKNWQPVPDFLPGKFHRQKGLVGYSLVTAKSQTLLTN